MSGALAWLIYWPAALALVLSMRWTCPANHTGSDDDSSEPEESA